MSSLNWLAHSPREPISCDEIVKETKEAHLGPWQHTWPPGTWRKNLSVDPDTKGATFLLYLPAGYGRPEEARARQTHPLGRFETHSCHEEIFNLGGQYHFGPWYEFPDLGYLNHPPHWVHPADQSTNTGVLLLIKNSIPVDFEFCPIPDKWDGVEGYMDPISGQISGKDGVKMLDTKSVPWQPLHTQEGLELGLEAKQLWHDRESNWRTWILRGPSGWTSPIEARESADGGDEMFLLDGDLEHPSYGKLSAPSYYCDPTRILFGGESTKNGFQAIRWTRGESMFELPDIQHDDSSFVVSN